MTAYIKRGEIYYADLSPVTGSEQGGLRPVYVFQNDIGNRFSPTVMVAAITSQFQKAKLKTHVEISAEKYKLDRDSVILLEQIRTIDKERLDYYNKVATLDKEDMYRVDMALILSAGLTELFENNIATINT